MDDTGYDYVFTPCVPTLRDFLSDYERDLNDQYRLESLLMPYQRKVFYELGIIEKEEQVKVNWKKEGF